MNKLWQVDFPSNVWKEMIEVRNIIRTDFLRDFNILQDILKVNGGLSHVLQILPKRSIHPWENAMGAVLQ